MRATKSFAELSLIPGSVDPVTAQRWSATAFDVDRHDRTGSGDAVAAVVHELRNYLMPVRSGTDLLARRFGGDPEAASTLAMLRRQVDGMQRLVADLLDVSRVGGRGLDVRCQRVVLQEVVEGAVAMGRPAADAKEQRVDWQGFGEALHVLTDPMRLQQAVSNLVLNAVRYSPPGTAIRVRAGRRGDDVQVIVTDDGNGMDATTQAHLFELYATGKGSCREALGIGLYLVRQIVRRLGGEVSAHSDGPGRGSTFTITLPASIVV
ncbi:MAG: sensor histidine kinase [Ramlibacter sp.]